MKSKKQKVRTLASGKKESEKLPIFAPKPPGGKPRGMRRMASPMKKPRKGMM